MAEAPLNGLRVIEMGSLIAGRSAARCWAISAPR
jgi:crotonobetainyl-CoA:carnitine CoA-transferase CaiB-like acyl-CoA transferase